MRKFKVDEIIVKLIYKDAENRWYETIGKIERDVSVSGGLSVSICSTGKSCNMIQPETLKAIGDGLKTAWASVGPLVGVLIGAMLTRAWDRRKWINENRKQEYRELLTTLTSACTALIDNAQHLFKARLNKSLREVRISSPFKCCRTAFSSQTRSENEPI